MAQIKTEKEYEAAMARIDELLPLPWEYSFILRCILWRKVRWRTVALRSRTP